jgi:hypothetical protein
MVLYSVRWYRVLRATDMSSTSLSLSVHLSEVVGYTRNTSHKEKNDIGNKTDRPVRACYHKMSL